MVFCVNHVQPQGSQVPRLQALTAVVSGLQEVPGRRTQDRWREAAAPPRAGPPSRPGSVSGSEAGGAQGDSVGHPLQGPCTRGIPLGMFPIRADDTEPQTEIMMGKGKGGKKGEDEEGTECSG